jgi:2-polyprenyl-3-methyl-5-hydroxy-6-metoxy-1,4-benzoquinol methylase
MIKRGGKDEERLYLHDLKIMHKGEEIIFNKTDMPNLDDIIQRHKSRYYLPAFFCRKGMKVLDFPCGSGYGYEILGENTIYEGRDVDSFTLMYARRIYNNSEKVFYEGDLTKSNIKENQYDIIACIEGLEHIEKDYQDFLIKSLCNGLKKDGRLIISTPLVDVSGPSKNNKYHKHELSEKDFMDLLLKYFDDVEIIKTEDILHNGNKHICAYGICRRDK